MDRDGKIIKYALREGTPKYENIEETGHGIRESRGEKRVDNIEDM